MPAEACRSSDNAFIHQLRYFILKEFSDLGRNGKEVVFGEGCLLNRLNLVTLGVQNMKESLQFYRDGLGFDVVVHGDEANPEVVFFNNAGTKISLFQIDHLVNDIDEKNPPAVGNGFSGITLAYNGKTKQEVDDVFAVAEQAGAKIIKAPEKVFWGGYSGYFQDPNGFYWEVAYGDMWEFDENEMLIIKE